jgi:hypothetical protein
VNCVVCERRSVCFSPSFWPPCGLPGRGSCAMPKEMVSIPEGNLLRAAETKSITTLSALKEKTDVDRKTLRAINAGQPVKRTTLQSRDLSPYPQTSVFSPPWPSHAGAQRHRLQHARSIKFLNGQISQILQQPDISSLKRASASVDQAQRANAASVGKN